MSHQAEHILLPFDEWLTNTSEALLRWPVLSPFPDSPPSCSNQQIRLVFAESSKSNPTVITDVKECHNGGEDRRTGEGGRARREKKEFPASWEKKMREKTGSETCLFSEVEGEEMKEVFEQ